MTLTLELRMPGSTETIDVANSHQVPKQGDRIRTRKGTYEALFDGIRVRDTMAIVVVKKLETQRSD